MKILKTQVSFLLLIIAISYSVDIHGLSHTFDEHSDDNKQCELCVISHDKDQHVYALKPIKVKFDFSPFEFTEKSSGSIKATTISSQSTYLRGQFFNRPPPFTL